MADLIIAPPTSIDDLVKNLAILPNGLATQPARGSEITPGFNPASTITLDVFSTPRTSANASPVSSSVVSNAASSPFMSAPSNDIIIAPGDKHSGIVNADDRLISNSGLINGGAVGIDLTNGGTVKNQATGTISANFGSAYAIRGQVVPVTVINAGSVDSLGGSAIGIALRAGGHVTNLASGTIHAEGGSAIGVDLDGGGTVRNQGGAIFAEGGAAIGVDLVSGGIVRNQSGAIRAEGGAAIGVLLGDGGVLANDATIDSEGGGAAGVALYAGGSIINANGGSIAAYGGSAASIELADGGTIYNQAGGRIGGTGSAILIGGGTATIVNAGTIISGYTDAINFNQWAARGSIEHPIAEAAGGTLVNAGTIIGNNAINFFNGFANRLVAEPGAVFIGKVDGGGALSTLELGPTAQVPVALSSQEQIPGNSTSGTSPGRLSGLGSQFINFGTLQFDDGANWFVSISSNGAPDQVTGFQQGDTIEVAGLTATGYSYTDTSGVLTLFGATAADSKTFTFKDMPDSLTFYVTNGPGGAEVTASAWQWGSEDPFAFDNAGPWGNAFQNDAASAASNPDSPAWGNSGGGVGEDLSTAVAGCIGNHGIAWDSGYPAPVRTDW